MIPKELAPALASCAKDGGGHDSPAVFCTTREASKDSCHFTHMSPTASGIQCLFEEHWQYVHQWILPSLSMDWSEEKPPC